MKFTSLTRAWVPRKRSQEPQEVIPKQHHYKMLEMSRRRGRLGVHEEARTQEETGIRKERKRSPAKIF